MLRKRLISLMSVATMLLSTLGMGVTAEGTYGAVDTNPVYSSELQRVIELPEDYSFGELQQLNASYDAGIASYEDSSDFLLDCGGRAGYDYLGTLSKGKQMQKLYDDMLKAATALWNDTSTKLSTISFGDTYAQYGDISATSLTMEEMSKVYFTFRNDNPIFYFAGGVAIGGDYYKFIMVADISYQNGSARASAQKKIKEYVTSRAAKAKGLTTDYAKAKAIHDAILNDVDYAYESGNRPSDAVWAHNIMGAVEKGKGVCEAYARTFQLMMNYLDVENYLVTGMANNGYMIGEHAWNLVRMDDGNYYYVDCTWDDSGWGYKYFAAGLDTMSSHKPSTPSGNAQNFLIELPAVSKTRFDPDNYVYKPRFKEGDVNGDGSVNAADITELINHIKNGNVSGDELARADVNKDGRVNAADITEVISIMKGR